MFTTYEIQHFDNYIGWASFGRDESILFLKKSHACHIARVISRLVEELEKHNPPKHISEFRPNPSRIKSSEGDCFDLTGKQIDDQIN